MVKHSESKVAVIGSGLGGLAAACTLAARGHQVTVFEKNEWLGGKAALLEEDGYRFDMGPTILTMPSVLRRIFAEAGESLEDHLELVPLDPQWRCFFTDGQTLDLVADTGVMASRLESFQPGQGLKEGYKAFMEHAAQLHKISRDQFFWRSVGGLTEMFKFRESFRRASLSELLAIRPGRSVAGVIRSYMGDERVAQMLDHFTQYVGSAPDSSPAVLCGIAHMQTSEGVWYPMGGTRAVPKALISLASELGVEFRTEALVERILTKSGRVTGLTLQGGDELAFDAVLSNSDAIRTVSELVESPPRSLNSSYRSPEPACSGVVLYLGLNKRYEHLLHHNFVFSEDAEEEFEAIYRKGEPAPDPTCYVCAPSMSEPGVAPPGGEALYVLVHAPYLRKHHNWQKMFPEYRQRILKKLADCAGLTDLEERIVVERALTPQDIHDRYRVLNGAIYGIASHGLFGGAFKPANKTSLDGLYLAGGAAHPGPGMPMVMMSGWIAADCLDRDHASLTVSKAG